MLREHKDDVVAVALLISVAAAVSYNYFTIVEYPSRDDRLELHRSIVEGAAPSPYNHRVLIPFLATVLANSLRSLGVSSLSRAVTLSYRFLDLVGCTLFLVTLFFFLKKWHPPLMSLVGTLFCAALIPISLRDHSFKPWSLFEAWFFCIAMLATLRRRHGLLYLITILASFNRTTGLFVPVIYLAGAFDFESIRKRG